MNPLNTKMLVARVRVLTALAADQLNEPFA